MKDLVRVNNLNVKFEINNTFLNNVLGNEVKKIYAVNDISFSIKEGEIFSLVGESGSGKTTTGKALIQLLREKEFNGEIFYKEKNCKEMNESELKKFRKNIQMIFQDPYQSLNPRHTIYEIVSEPIEIHKLGETEEEKFDLVKKALEDAGLKPGEDFMERYPHELSGGQRQRVAIAGAMILKPDFIIADEPVSMLDVSIRADILKLMVSLRDKNNISYLFITHDISLAWMISDRIAIMYLGKIVEIGTSDQIIKTPKHPYSKALIDVMPKLEPRKGRDRNILKGEIPNPIDLPNGCFFHPRCPMAKEICKKTSPKIKKIEENHFVFCHLV